MLPASFDAYAGPAAGIATSVLWTFTSLSFTAASRRLGVVKVNAIRIGMAVVWLGLMHRLLTGAWIPTANGRQVLYLALSGLIGLSLGDLALFTAYVRIGPRLASLVMTTAPIFAALFGWLALGETLQGRAWIGMALTIGGVAWVVRERPANGVLADPHRGSGLFLAFVAAACQAAGLLFSKAGIGHGWLPAEQYLKPQTATLLRMFFAGVFVLPTLLWLARTTKATPAAPLTPQTRRAGYVFTLLGSIFGPFLGVWMSLEAANRAPLGVAQTLCSLPPVFILPFVWVAGERVSVRAVVGAFIAVAGIALLFKPAAPA